MKLVCLGALHTHPHPHTCTHTPTPIPTPTPTPMYTYTHTHTHKWCCRLCMRIRRITIPTIQVIEKVVKCMRVETASLWHLDAYKTSSYKYPMLIIRVRIVHFSATTSLLLPYQLWLIHGKFEFLPMLFSLTTDFVATPLSFSSISMRNIVMECRLLFSHCTVLQYNIISLPGSTVQYATKS